MHLSTWTDRSGEGATLMPAVAVASPVRIQVRPDSWHEEQHRKWSGGSFSLSDCLPQSAKDRSQAGLQGLATTP